MALPSLLSLRPNPSSFWLPLRFSLQAMDSFRRHPMLYPIPPSVHPQSHPRPLLRPGLRHHPPRREQSPGATMTSKEKLVVARQLSRLGVDIIEAGFPASSPDDLDAVRSIAMEVGNQPVSEGGHIPVICGLARCNKKDIDAAWEAVRHAKKSRVHTFIATSEIHMQHKLRKTREEVVRIACEMVAYARSLGCQDIEFSPEDAGRFFPSLFLC